MVNIYVVCAYIDYEGSDVVRAFLKQESAKDFKKQCEEHHKLKRDMDIDEWLAKHPAGSKASYCVDGYMIKTVEFDAT